MLDKPAAEARKTMSNPGNSDNEKASDLDATAIQTTAKATRDNATLNDNSLSTKSSTRFYQQIYHT